MNRAIIHKHLVSALLILIVVVSGAFCDAIPRKVQKGQEAWRSLKQAQNAFESNDFVHAIQFAEKAKEIRRQDAQWQSYTLENTLRKAKVRKEHDVLDAVKVVLSELDMKEALDIVDFHVKAKGIDYFSNKFSKLVEYMDFYSHYPEADYLLGKIYRLEGEFKIAAKYMEEAYKHSENLDVPMQKYDLLYDLADLSYDLDEKNNFEKYLLLIVKDDPYYRDEIFMKSILRIINENSKKSVEKFFLLYRCENDLSLESLIKLCEFYSEIGESEKTLRCSALASIIALTKIESVLSQRITSYEYNGFEDALTKCSRYSDIVDWGNKNKIWEIFCILATSSADNGKTNYSNELLKILSRAEPEEYWRDYASQKLIK